MTNIHLESNLAVAEEIRMIPESTRLQLIGLQTLAKHHNRMLESIAVAAAELVGDTERGGAVCDFIYNSENRSVDWLWEQTEELRLAKLEAEMREMRKRRPVGSRPGRKG